jgi:hypothetical protein
MPPLASESFDMVLTLVFRSIRQLPPLESTPKTGSSLATLGRSILFADWEVNKFLKNVKPLWS